MRDGHTDMPPTADARRDLAKLDRALTGDKRSLDRSPPPPDGCPPMPSCNWCGGSSIYDAKGCITGWVCANGANPCSTMPCGGSAPVCKPGESCHADQLCWPAADSGPAPDLKGSDAKHCGSKACGGSSAGDCECSWTCPGGVAYSVACKPKAGAPGMDCDCQINGTTTKTCTSSSVGGAACSINTCCAFPQ